jgi:enamine deaminase RidA (YjgF/YER057c/UK114 family)
MGLCLPEVLPPRGNFQPFLISGSQLYLSGKGSPAREPMRAIPKVGREIPVDEAYRHARDVGLYLLALMKQALGDFDRVEQVARVFGMVNAVPDFTEHTQVINGCSDLLVAVLGERGRHARSAIGVASLPAGFAVEVEAVVEIR